MLKSFFVIPLDSLLFKAESPLIKCLPESKNSSSKIPNFSPHSRPFQLEIRSIGVFQR